MKPINFINKENKNKQLFSLPWLIFTISLMLVTAITIGYFHSNAKKTWLKAHKKNQKLAQQKLEITQLEQEISELNCKKSDLKKDIETLNKKSEKNNYALTIINDIGAIKPKKISLTNVTLDKKSTMLEGSAKNQKSMQKFLDACAQTHWCKHAQLEILPSDNNELTLFNLTLSHK